MRRREEGLGQRGPFYVPGGGKASDGGGEHIAHRFEGELAFMPGEDTAMRIEEHQCRPGPHPVALPDRHTGIVHDRVADLVALDGGAQVGGLRFGGKLGGMDPDDDELVGECVLKLPRPREDVETVDSAVGPKIEDHQLTTQIGEGQGRRIKPVEPGRKFRRANRTGIEISHGALPPLGQRTILAARAARTLRTRRALLGEWPFQRSNQKRVDAKENTRQRRKLDRASSREGQPGIGSTGATRGALLGLLE